MENQGTKIAENRNSRSSSGKHLMPLSLSAHTQRHSEQERKDHNQTNLQGALATDKVQHGRGSHQETDGGQDEDEADDHIDAAFAVEAEFRVVGL